jgi:glycyl-tRNA synthetase
LSGFQLGSDEKMISELAALLKRRGFFFPSYEIYGGVAGFFDMGPMGSLLKDNILRLWKDRFVIGEGFLLVDCPSVTPEIVFRHSGHLEKFTDQLTRCTRCGEPFRADHLLTGIIENPDALSNIELGSAMKENGVVCPRCGGQLGDLEEFNLMFKTHIGAGTERPAFMRPETAQSIFLDFPLLYRQNRERIPFGVAQIGKGFRNEISPRQGLLRQREFFMAEGEFFFDPEEKSFPEFEATSSMVVNLVPNTHPEKTVRMELKKAVDEGVICSEVLGHFMGVTYSFASDIGIPEEHMRFREHLTTEMAHYARDCWDLEVLTSYGWIEMVGIADRSAYDLTQHMKGSGQEMTALRRYKEPVRRKVPSVTVDMKVLGPVFRGEARDVMEKISLMEPDEVKKRLDSDEPIIVNLSSADVEVPRDSISVTEEEKTVSGERYVPHVIEPSFGIDRLMMAVIEHSYHEAKNSPLKEKDEEETEQQGPYRILRLLPSISPVKCGIFPLMNKDGMPEIALSIERKLRNMGMMTYYDHSGSIGRRYARMDEIGTPFNLTVDYDSIRDGTVTIRERDSGAQKRIPSGDVHGIVEDLIQGRRTFDDLKYPTVN